MPPRRPTACLVLEQAACRWWRKRSGAAPLLHRWRAPMVPSPDELLVDRHAAATKRAIFGSVGGKVSAHEAEDRLAVQLDRRSPPQAPHTDDMGSELLDEVDEKLECGPGAHEVLDQQYLRALANQPLELDGQGDASLAAGHPLHAVHDDRAGGMRTRDAVREDQRSRTRGQDHVDGPRREVPR